MKKVNVSYIRVVSRKNCASLNRTKEVQDGIERN